ncbi:MAG TPA: NlpC/P60 family protein [Candidatus Paceibacterota bacterium]|nr:NlpC/P60 family protein [Candidatus Paceibacterota bacterium]
MWRYRIGFTAEQLNANLGVQMSFEDICLFLDSHGLSFTYDLPEQVIRSVIPQVLGAKYKNPSVMREDAPQSFSCSSLVSYLYILAGMPWMPSISVDKYVFGDVITEDELRFGDLIFTNSGEGRIYYETIEWKKGTPVPEGVDHVGVYMGDGKVLHASKKSGGVAIEDLSIAPSFDRIVGYRRIGDITKKHFAVFIPDEMPALRNTEAFFTWMSQNKKTP